jgi:hypothetical protein
MNRLIKEQSYRRIKSFTDGLLASQEENVLPLKVNYRF